MIRIVTSSFFDNFIVGTVFINIQVIFNTFIMASIGLIDDTNIIVEKLNF